MTEFHWHADRLARHEFEGSALVEFQHGEPLEAVVAIDYYCDSRHGPHWDGAILRPEVRSIRASAGAALRVRNRVARVVFRELSDGRIAPSFSGIEECPILPRCAECGGPAEALVANRSSTVQDALQVRRQDWLADAYSVDLAAT